MHQYKSVLGINSENDSADEVKTTEAAVSSIKYIDVDGNTYIYIIYNENNI